MAAALKTVAVILGSVFGIGVLVLIAFCVVIGFALGGPDESRHWWE